MSRTLFWYILKDLLKIFLLTTAALAGIMSFGGLLRPLTDQGLDASQIGRVLLFFLPAMLTYSLPIAAIFATTMVYGRLAADNETLGCRGAGISHLSLALPALVLGLSVAIISLLFLCFIVPAAILRVERIVKSNIAQIVANQIERSHQMPFKMSDDSEGMSIFAERAEVLPQKDPNDQVVMLYGPMIITTRNSPPLAVGERRPSIPERFYMAKQATVYITQNPATDEVFIEATLNRGTGFSRDLTGSTQGGITETHFGPRPVPSPIKENTKFMNILRLDEVYLQPEKSRKISESWMKLVCYEQEKSLLDDLQTRFREDGGIELASALNPDDTLRISGYWAGEPQRLGEELILRSDNSANTDSADGNGRTLHLNQRDTSGQLACDAREIRLRAHADNATGRIIVVARLLDLLVRSGEQLTSQNELSPSIQIAMPPAIEAIRNRPADYYARTATVPADARESLARDLRILRNNIQSEKNGRAAFAISCLILVLIGCALGMMFRSGNFLSAFAVSAVPAIIIITLIISGQQVSGNAQIADGLRKGLALIWSGNAVVAALAVFLLARLQRQ